MLSEEALERNIPMKQVADPIARTYVTELAIQPTKILR